MALTDENMVMPVSPMGASGGGFGGFGNDGWWIILLLLCFGNNGWGNNGGSNGLYPWLSNSNQINDGFRDQMLNGTINNIQNGITAGFGDVQNALCGGFASVNAAIANSAAQGEISANSRQMANMNQIYGISSQLAQCCCDNRMATVQTQNLVSSEGAATRLAIQEQTQAILDKMCQQEIDALKAQNIALQNQVNMQNLAASQTAQTAALIADNTAQTQYLVNRIAPYPAAAYIVPNPNGTGTTT